MYPGFDTAVCVDLLFRRSDETNWTVVYNGSATKWEVVGLELEKTYVFRVAAHNSMGWGQPSEESSRHMYTPPLAGKCNLIFLLARKDKHYAPYTFH